MPTLKLISLLYLHKDRKSFIAKLNGLLKKAVGQLLIVSKYEHRQTVCHFTWGEYEYQLAGVKLFIIPPDCTVRKTKKGLEFKDSQSILRYAMIPPDRLQKFKRRLNGPLDLNREDYFDCQADKIIIGNEDVDLWLISNSECAIDFYDALGYLGLSDDQLTEMLPYFFGIVYPSAVHLQQEISKITGRR